MGKFSVSNIVMLAVTAGCFAGCAIPDSNGSASQSTPAHSASAHSTHSSARQAKAHQHAKKRQYKAYSPQASGYAEVAMIRAAGGIVIQRGQVMRIILPYAKFFDTYDPNKIKVAKRSALHSVAQLLKNQYSRSPIRVIGFTDASGTHVEQIARAKRTAQVVYSYLWDHSVSPRRMSLISGGSSEPLGSDAGFFAGWSDNRRVEVRVGLPSS